MSFGCSSSGALPHEGPWCFLLSPQGFFASLNPRCLSEMRGECLTPKWSSPGLGKETTEADGSGSTQKSGTRNPEVLSILGDRPNTRRWDSIGSEAPYGPHGVPSVGYARPISVISTILLFRRDVLSVGLG